MRAHALIVFALVALAALAGCDSGSSQPAATSTVPAATETTVAEAPPTAAQPAATTPPAEQPSATGVAQASPPAPTPDPQPPTPNTPDKGGPLKLQPTTLESPSATMQQRTINLPPGFHIKVFASGLSGVRWLGLGPDGLIYATSPSQGTVVTMAFQNGAAGPAKTFADNLGGVHGIAFKDNAVYVATVTDIVRLEDTNKDGVADKRDVLAADLPSGGGHSTRTLAFGPDGKLYVSAGSSCNVCIETNPKRAAISRYSAGGKFEEIYAKGLRNAVGLVFHPVTGELWATNNGRDNLGDNIPPETIYNVKEGADYGWPYCYGDRVPDKTMSPPAGYCEKTGVPAVKMGAHMAPLGLAFYTGNQFPAQFKGDMFVALHGSWNSSVRVGYKLVRVRFANNEPDTSAGNLLVEDFATGWLANDGVWGRPVDPLVAPDGSLLLTDDNRGVIYDIYYK